MTAAALVLAVALGSSPPSDDDRRRALALLYDGYTDTAIDRLDSLTTAAPDDPMGVYLGALAFCWKIEERPESRALEPEFHRRVDRAIALADARLERDPGDVRALLARGAAHGVRSRLHLFRLEGSAAARAAVRMRGDLLEVRRLDAGNKDAFFGLGLYDYYADVLPRFVKLVRFLAGIPGGNRERGLAEIAAAREGSLFHSTEVEWQLYEIYAFYEEDPDRAEPEIEALRERYPNAPLWGLKLAEHRRDRLGLFAESAAVSRQVLASVERGRPNYSPVVGDLARLSLGEALLLDLRPGEAATALRTVRAAATEAWAVGPRAELLLGRALELEGDRPGSLPHYRFAAEAVDREVRRRAERALAAPIPDPEVRALRRLGEARRSRGAGRPVEALGAYRDALRLWPSCREAALRVAEADLDAGRLAAARRGLRGLEGAKAADPPWLRPSARLLLARIHDATGDRMEALRLYKEVFKHPFGQKELRRAAEEGLRRRWVPPAADAAAPSEP